ncbi:MAG TPA: UDP-N-acetylmuramoyl-L-alanine--D-glutamate ligase [Devosiaceae bacterium]|nr:UDP-N-acetylmuramoyl-L-alanine--D-glutamate ligase [Devosiaceae bacterium]
MRPEPRVLIYGAGREAKSIRRFLAETRPELAVDVCADTGTPALPDTTTVPVAGLAEAFRTGRYAMVMRSAGVSIYKPEIEAAKAAGVPVGTNVNAWASHRRGHATVITVTGTKGKSTTAKLTHSMLVASEIDAGLGGNIGVPPLDLDPHAVVVLELSSYQIADLELDPDIVGITNLYREHLDWHGSIDRYYADKLAILDRRGDYRLAVGPQAATHPAFQAKHVPPFRLLPSLSADFEDKLDDAVRASRLKGGHNRDNAVLAARLALAAGATEQGVLAAVAAFEPLPHRLQEFSFGGITFVDDSIATTPAATLAAIDAYPLARLALIAGGYDRGQDYEELVRRLDGSNVMLLACLPATGERLAEVATRFAPAVEIVAAESLESAMRQLRDRRNRFDTVLLSPGAPSFGQFRDFEERGDKFVEFAEFYFGR